MDTSPAITLRPWAAADAPRMAELVNNPAVYRTLAAGVPAPYRVEHALGFIAACNNMSYMEERAIVRGAEIVGTIGATLEGRRALPLFMAARLPTSPPCGQNALTLTPPPGLCWRAVASPKTREPLPANSPRMDKPTRCCILNGCVNRGILPQ